MKRIFIDKPEPLLLIVTLILFLLHKIFTPDSVMDIHPPNSPIKLDTNFIFWIVFVFVIVPLMIHFLLRVSGKWDGFFCRPQVYITITLLLLLFILNHMNISQQAPKGSLASSYIDSWNYNKAFAITFLLGIIVQFLFTIYFLIRIFQKS